VSKQSSQRREFFFEEINSSQVKPKYPWSCLSSPFWHHRKRIGRVNKVNQGVCNHHHLGNGGKKNNLRYTQVYGTLMILVIRVMRKQVIAQASTAIKRKNQDEI